MLLTSCLCLLRNSVLMSSPGDAVGRLWSCSWGLCEETLAWAEGVLDSCLCSPALWGGYSSYLWILDGPWTCYAFTLDFWTPNQWPITSLFTRYLGHSGATTAQLRQHMCVCIKLTLFLAHIFGGQLNTLLNVDFYFCLYKNWFYTSVLLVFL